MGLATFSYVLAADKGCTEAELVSVRFGSPTYNGQIIVRADSGLNSIADLKGKAFCRADPLSTSSWIIPNNPVWTQKVLLRLGAAPFSLISD